MSFNKVIWMAFSVAISMSTKDLIVCVTNMSPTSWWQICRQHQKCIGISIWTSYFNPPFSWPTWRYVGTTLFLLVPLKLLRLFSGFNGFICVFIGFISLISGKNFSNEHDFRHMDPFYFHIICRIQGLLKFFRKSVFKVALFAILSESAKLCGHY